MNVKSKAAARGDRISARDHLRRVSNRELDEQIAEREAFDIDDVSYSDEEPPFWRDNGNAQTETPPDDLGERDAGDDTGQPPPRGWLLANAFCRKFIGSLLGDGGVGKTALRYVQYLSLVTGNSLTGEHVFQRCRVLIISLEDDTEELQRRILAAMMHYGIDRADLKGWLFYAAPGAAAGKLMTTDKNAHAERGRLADSIEATVIKRNIDLVAIDPFVKSHTVPENENSIIDEVMQVLVDLAVKRNIAIDTPHHVSKGIAEPGNANKGRGASSMVDAARLVFTLTTMSTEEAAAFGVPGTERKQYVRVDSGKVNIARSGGAPKWFKLIGIRLGNATELYPNGDEVQTVEPWKPPETWADLSDDLLNRVLTKIDAGLPGGNRYTDAPRGGERSAWKVITDLAPTKTEAQAREIIKTWVKNKVLVSDEYENPKTRKMVSGLKVDNSKRPGASVTAT